MYESPLSRIYGEIQTKIIEHEENQILQAVQNCGITVDKEELTRALMYDRQQYEKGYADAKAEEQWIPVSERLPEEDTDVLVSVYFMGLQKKHGVNEYLKPSYYVDIARCYDGEWSSYSDEFKVAWDRHKVIAWQPLPEAYKGE